MESEDIKGTLPQEARHFAEVIVIWKEVTGRISSTKPVLELTKGNNIL
jgi:hypothetical protein